MDIPIPANDDSAKTIELICDVFANAILDGTQIARAKQAEQMADGERHTKESDTDESGVVKRRMRERRVKKEAGKGNINGTRMNDGEATEETNA